jgi:hypothetical protein
MARIKDTLADAAMCSIDGSCDDNTFYYVVAIVLAIIIGGLIFINMKKPVDSTSKDDAHVHGCEGDKCYL